MQNVHYRAKLLQAIENAIQDPPNGLQIKIEASEVLGEETDFINIVSGDDTVDEIKDSEFIAGGIEILPDGTRKIKQNTCCEKCHYQVTETFIIEVYLAFCEEFYLKDAQYAHFIMSRMAKTPFEYNGSRSEKGNDERAQTYRTVRAFSYSYTYEYDINNPNEEIIKKK